jgi:hypothetical protein
VKDSEFLLKSTGGNLIGVYTPGRKFKNSCLTNYRYYSFLSDLKISFTQKAVKHFHKTFEVCSSGPLTLLLKKF